MQYSLFGAAVDPPTRDDLDGLLLAGALWANAGRERARLSVLVAGRWRAEALEQEFAARDLPAETLDAELSARDLPPALADQVGSLRAVRTAFREDLVTAAARWSRGANAAVPSDLRLTAGGLRLWTIAAGRPDETGHLLATAAAATPLHRAAGARLASLGVSAVSLGERGGPGWRITGHKRLRRLAELVGEPPDGAGTDWPIEP